jgi:dipeptidyl-peptidase-4
MKSRKILLFVIIASLVYGQNKKLTFQQAFYFGQPRLTKSLPQIKGWLDDEHYLELSVRDGKSIIEKVNVENNEREVYLDYSQIGLPEGFNLNEAVINNDSYTKFIFERDNDLYYLSVEDNLFKKLTDDEAEEKNPKFSPDGKKVAYTKENNLYCYDIENEIERRLTDDGGDLVYNGWASWVYMEEILGRSTNYAAFWWAPDSRKISFLRFDDSPVPEFILVKADGQHGSVEKQRYPKAGDPNPFVKLGIADLEKNNIVWADFPDDNDQYIAWPVWTRDSQLTVQWMNRKQDTIKIYRIDVKDGSKRLLHTEHQKTWVEWFEDIYFMKNNPGFIIRTGLDGYYHLYLYDGKGKLLKKLTDGADINVTSLELVDEKNNLVYFEGWSNNSTERHLFVVNMNNNKITKLTDMPGTHACNLSPNGRYFIDRFSCINTPPALLLYDANGELIREIGNSKSDIFDEYELPKAQLFKIKTEDGYDLPALWYLPEDLDSTKKYPVLISIYGGPNAPTVRNSFPYRLEPQFLAQNGIIYMSVDHRGSGHFGKAGTDLMHRNLGKWEMHDYIEAVKWLRKLPFVDTAKIAINGGSYGGYVTALALTSAPGYFNYGIAEFGVMDWMLYDNVYTERYMDTPDENPDGYKKSSVLNYAENYKGGMLIIHGTMDDNVHMQNSIQLIDKLQRLNKEFEMMFYPNQRHGIRFPHYFHAQKTIAEFIFKNLLNKELSTD